MIGLLPFGAMSQPAAMPPTMTTTAAAPTSAPPVVAPDKEQLSYAVGTYYARYLTNDIMQKLGLEPKADLDLKELLSAFTNMVSGYPTTMDLEGAVKILQQQTAYQKQVVQEEIKKVEATGPENKAKGEKFMDEIGAKAGVTKLASGVVYEVIKDGAGEKPSSNDVATLTMRSTLIDGTKIMELVSTAVSISNQGLPPGVREVLPMMKAGSHWRVYLPYLQAFGDKPAVQDPKHGFKIAPYSAMIFDVEVESFKAGPPPRATPPARGAPTTATPGVTVTPQPAHPFMNTTSPGGVISTPVTSSGIVRVPSAAEAEKGEKPRIMTDAEVEAAKKAATNAPAPK